MNLTPAQTQRFWREWAATVKACNWDRAQGEIERRAMLERCGFSSLTRVDRLDGFTKVLNEVISLRGDNVQAAIESEDQTINKAVRLRYVILEELVPCLELYVSDVRRYLQEILDDRNRWWRIYRNGRAITLLDLDAKPIRRRDGRSMPSQLDQVRMTLQARLNTLRAKSKDTIHDMKLRAQVKCDCRHCGGCVPSIIPETILNLPTDKPELGPEIPVEADCPF